MSSTENTATSSTPWVRKRKRNNSSVSLPDGIIAPEPTPTTSPTKLAAPKPLRIATPPLIRDETPPPPSTAGSEQIVSGNTSPVIGKIVNYETSLSGSNSPRAAVARRLSNMNINKGESESELEETLDEPIASSSEPRGIIFRGKLGKEKVPETSENMLPVLEQSPSSSDQRPTKRLPPPRGIKSPPPKGVHHISSPILIPTEASSSSSTPSSSQPTVDNWFDLSTLTWQDSEITGHLMLDPEDDGYGINGIGFRPSPAMAVARSQRRKQQLTAWRTREEREERERRAEKRRQGRALFPDSDIVAPVPVLNLSSIADSLDKKVVRFSV